MEITFNNQTPIYLQIVNEIKKQIISGKLSAGTRIPSVRELAIKYQVNPNTMQKALSELETEGLLFTERTNGKFVTTDEKIIETIKSKFEKEITDKYISEMTSLGITKKEIIERLK